MTRQARTLVFLCKVGPIAAGLLLAIAAALFAVMRQVGPEWATLVLALDVLAIFAAAFVVSLFIVIPKR